MAGQYFGPSQLQLRVPSCRQAGGLSETSVKSVVEQKRKSYSVINGHLWGRGFMCAQHLRRLELLTKGCSAYYIPGRG